MSGSHTIFDTRRVNSDDPNLTAELTTEEIVKLLEVENDNESAFLAERGELSSASKKYLWH